MKYKKYLFSTILLLFFLCGIYYLLSSSSSVNNQFDLSKSASEETKNHSLIEIESFPEASTSEAKLAIKEKDSPEISNQKAAKGKQGKDDFSYVRLERRPLVGSLLNEIDSLKARSESGDINATVVLGASLNECTKLEVSTILHGERDAYKQKRPLDKMCEGIDPVGQHRGSIKYLKEAAINGDVEGMLLFIDSPPYHLEGYFESFKDPEASQIKVESELLEFKQQKLKFSRDLLSKGNINGALHLATTYYGDPLIRKDVSKYSEYNFEAYKYALISASLMGNKVLVSYIVEDLGNSMPIYEIDRARDEINLLLERFKNDSVQITKF
jgi:hypothetical protein